MRAADEGGDDWVKPTVSFHFERSTELRGTFPSPSDGFVPRGSPERRKWNETVGERGSCRHRATPPSCWEGASRESARNRCRSVANRVESVTHREPRGLTARR